MHIPVLLDEAVELLNLKKGSVVVDATLGGAGHFKKIVSLIGKEGTAIGIDVDERAIEELGSSFSDDGDHPKIILVNDNFSNLEKVLGSVGIDKVDAVLADLGWRSDQMDDESYGLSFRKEAPLNMRLQGGAHTQDKSLTAFEIINTWPEEKLGDIFQRYGEEKFARLAARSIVQSRKQKQIQTTTELAQILEQSLGGRYRRLKIHPATRVFQALRIVVNDELESLETFLPQALRRLKGDGRIAIISFHSLEDRIVKEFFRTNARGCVCPKEFPVCVCGKKPALRIITKKPVTADEDELRKNPRARSAKLRVAQKI